MNPVQLILGAASVAGAIFGGQRKHIDPEWLKKHFGPGAISAEALQLFNNLINSPYGQSVMTNAAEQGQQLQRSINKQSINAGLSGPGGASSGTGIFATSAAEGATNAAQRDVAGQFYQSVLPVAQQSVNNRMQAYLQDMQNGGTQTDSARVWQNIGNAAGTAGSMYEPKSPVDNGMPITNDQLKLNQATTPILQQAATNRFTPISGAVQPLKPRWSPQ